MASIHGRSVALVVDPDPTTHRAFASCLESAGFRTVRATTAGEAIERFQAATPSLVLVDLNLPDMPGRQLLRQFRTDGSRIPVIALANSPDPQMIMEATRAGATDFLDKAVSLEKLRSAVERLLPGVGRPEAASRTSPDPWERDRLQFLAQYEQLFRRSERMRALERLVIRVADTNAAVLIQGETGVGKELVAKAIHYLSDRSGKPWVKVNCASLPAELLESELFGHEKGAFTGAASQKPGRFELAHGGTFLLDEIGEMPLSLQSKILHVLQDSEFFRVGGRELISVDVRILAATNKNIQMMVASGSFREDLYYRLNVVNIFVSPLRERREEIPFLIEYFCEKFTRQFNRPRGELSAETRELLMTYDWPGNIRELENVIKRYVVLEDEAHLRDELQVRLRVTSPPPPAGSLSPSIDTGAIHLGLREIARRAAREAERAAIEQVLERVHWNRAEAARLLKISYKTLLAKLIQAGFGKKLRAPGREGSQTGK